MSLESRIEAGGRRILRSPLWTGIAVTLFFVLPTVVVPGVPLWISALVFVSVGPPIIVLLYLVFGIYGRLFETVDRLFGSSDETEEPTDQFPPDVETPVDRLKYRYANGEIDEETFEQRLDGLMKTEELSRRVEERKQVETELELRS